MKTSICERKTDKIGVRKDETMNEVFEHHFMMNQSLEMRIIVLWILSRKIKQFYSSFNLLKFYNIEKK